MLTQLGHPNIGYKSQVCIEIIGGALGQEGDNFTDSETVLNRIEFIVDGAGLTDLTANPTSLELLVSLDSQGEVLVAGAGPIAVCGEANLDLGWHNVIFEFRQTSGDIKTYSWQFELTKEEEIE